MQTHCNDFPELSSLDDGTRSYSQLMDSAPLKSNSAACLLITRSWEYMQTKDGDHLYFTLLTTCCGLSLWKILLPLRHLIVDKRVSVGLHNLDSVTLEFGMDFQDHALQGDKHLLNVGLYLRL